MINIEAVKIMIVVGIITALFAIVAFKVIGFIVDRDDGKGYWNDEE